MKSLDKSEYDRLMSSKSSFVIEFFAPWCSPCMKQKPMVEKLAFELTGKLDIYSCDCDQEMDVPSILRVMAIPTIVFFKAGKEFDRMVGNYSSERAIREKVEKMMCGGGL